MKETLSKGQIAKRAWRALKQSYSDLAMLQAARQSAQARATLATTDEQKADAARADFAAAVQIGDVVQFIEQLSHVNGVESQLKREEPKANDTADATVANPGADAVAAARAFEQPPGLVITP